MGEEVVRILRIITSELSIVGDALIIGDSTSAYCVDHKKERTWRDIRDKAKDECGVNFYFESWRGAAPRFSEPGGKCRLEGLLIRLGNPYCGAEFRWGFERSDLCPLQRSLRVSIEQFNAPTIVSM